MPKQKSFFLILSLTLLSSCASLTTGRMQTVAVSTGERNGAACTLTNAKGKWYIGSTPKAVYINRSYSDLFVTCNLGDYSGMTVVQSSTRAMAFGNLLFGGIVGGAIDAKSGAAYNYPPQIYVQLNNKNS